MKYKGAAYYETNTAMDKILKIVEIVETDDPLKLAKTIADIIDEAIENELLWAGAGQVYE
jgi:hypothetical protein